MVEEYVEQLNVIQKEMLEAQRTYEHKMAKVWDRISRLKKEMKELKSSQGF